MSINEYSISKWPDTKEIYEKINKLLKSPMRPIKKEKMQGYMEYYTNKCKGSKALNDEAKKYIPGGVQHNLAFNYPFPMAMKKAEGAYMWDVDDNKYIDFLQAGGPIILGNNYKPVRDKVIELLQECGPTTGLFHEYELKLAKIINQYMPSIELFRMLGSGTEGDLAAIRVARTFTGKRKVIKIGGAYHGWSDQMIYGIHIPGTGRYEAHGIPKSCTEDTQESYPNDVEGLRKLLVSNEAEGGTAAILLEPLGPESGTRPVEYEFNKKVRELCDEFGTLLVFDEVVTGFRVGMGGAQGYFNVKPDLTVFGKIVAGGYPGAGGIGGRRDVMSCVATGVEGKQRAYVGGTLSANPLSCAAGYYAIKEIAETNAAVKAGEAGDKICSGLQSIIDKYDLPFVVYNHGSICHLETTGMLFLDVRDPNFLNELKNRAMLSNQIGAAYMAEGMVTLAGSRLYTSMADTDEVINDALAKFDDIFSNM